MFDKIGGIHHGHREFGLKFWLLSLLEKQESTGAMLIDKMEQSSMGFWKPSPGSIYPLLSTLVSDGSLKLKVQDGKKYYKITDKGRELINNSWFPWKKFMRPQATNTIDNTLNDMENEVEYLTEKSEDINKNPSTKAQLKKLVEKLKKI